MTGHPGFGTMLARLLTHRGLDVVALAEAAGVAESDLREVSDGSAPSPSLLRGLAPALGFHTADLFIIARVPVPDDLAPIDPEAGAIVGDLIAAAIRLRPDQRAEILRFARSMPQQPRTSATAAKEPLLNRFEPSLGATLAAMLYDNRNLNDWQTVVAAIRCLTDGRVYLAAATLYRVAGQIVAPKPEWLAGMATTLGIPVGDISALADLDLPEAPADPAAADMAELLWEARRLTADQARTVRTRALALRS